MEKHQTTQEEETTLFLFSDSEDETPPQTKRRKLVSDLCSSERFLDFGLQERKPVPEVIWKEMFDFELYTPGPLKKDYEDMFTKFENELKAFRKGYNKATLFFKHKFGELDKKHPCYESSEVVETIRRELKQVEDSIRKAKDVLPSSRVAVRSYINYRETTLFELKCALDEYSKKLKELAERPKVDKLVEFLMNKVKFHQSIEECTGLEMSHMRGIIRIMMGKPGFCYAREANTMSVEEFDQSAMKEVVNDNLDSMVNIRASWEAYKTAEAKVEEDGRKHAFAVGGSVGFLIACLESADFFLRIMRGQFELLWTQNVIANGLGEFFDDDWIKVTYRHGITRHFYVKN